MQKSHNAQGAKAGKSRSLPMVFRFESMHRKFYRAISMACGMQKTHGEPDLAQNCAFESDRSNKHRLFYAFFARAAATSGKSVASSGPER
jgi:hypothetical protein